MVYVVLNIFLFSVLLWFSSYADKKSDSLKTKQIIKPIIFLALVCLINALGISAYYFGNLRIANILGKIYAIVVSYFYITITTYVCRFPKCGRSVVSKLVSGLLLIVSVYLVVAKIDTIYSTVDNGLVIQSKEMESLGIQWIKIYEIFFFALLPAFSILSIFLRIEVTKNKNGKQQMILIVLSVAVGFLMLAVFGFIGDKLIPAFDLLIPFVCAFEVYLIYRIAHISILYDIKTCIIIVFEFVINYLLLGALAGVAFALLLQVRETNITLFILLIALIISVLLIARYNIAKILSKLRGNRTTNYLQQFEKDLASLDYTESPEVLFEILVKYFKKNVNTDALDFLTESGDEGLKTLFSSRDKQVTIPANSKFFDVALNANHTVIFKSQLESKHYFDSVKSELSDLFEKTQSEVLILLTEGRHVFSAMLLGEKHLGNEYTDYDFSVFSRFYSYFFVFGYYLKNIANESIVGTVTREIQMSGQIIQSIQENMDFIKNPKVDVGYLSVAAHDLGGEYIDFIKLNEDKHIFIIGDISGKGINASMSAVIMKSIVRTFLAETKDFKQLVQKVNVFIRNHLPKETFFAGVFGLMDFAENTLYYLNCGIPALLMYNQSYNNVIEVQGEGRVLGFVRNIEKLVKVKKLKLNPGDIVLACTDGLLNAKNIRGEKFGKDRVQQSVVENLGFPAEKMSQFVYDQLLDFTSKELEDDISVLTIKYLSK